MSPRGAMCIAAMNIERVRASQTDGYSLLDHSSNAKVVTVGDTDSGTLRSTAFLRDHGPMREKS